MSSATSRMSSTDIRDSGGKRPRISVKTDLFVGNGGEAQHSYFSPGLPQLDEMQGDQRVEGGLNVSKFSFEFQVSSFQTRCPVATDRQPSTVDGLMRYPAQLCAQSYSGSAGPRSQSMGK